MAGKEGVWRMGAVAYDLTLAGYCVVRVSSRDALPMLEHLDYKVYDASQDVQVAPTLFVLCGSLGIFDTNMSGAVRKLGKVEAGEVLLCLNAVDSTSGLRIRAMERTEVCVLAMHELLAALQPLEGAADAMVRGLADCLARQNWVLNMCARGEPLQRLCALLLGIADDIGGFEGYALPEPKELAVLAGISRESAVINLRWLESQGAIAKLPTGRWKLDRKRVEKIAREE